MIHKSHKRKMYKKMLFEDRENQEKSAENDNMNTQQKDCNLARCGAVGKKWV